VKNLEIARLFDLIADLLEIKGENPFRIRAYRRAKSGSAHRGR
jgi:DNA polymerase (family 10)